MRVRVLSKTLAGLRPGAKLFLAIWLLFLLLVAVGVHGASTPQLVKYWSRQPYNGYVLGKLDEYAKETAHLDSDALDQLCMTIPPEYLWDDYLLRFPTQLSQLTHQPRFPVVNTNYWNGQNMLVASQFAAPVWHIATIARPSAWGYFFLGPQRGMAWDWWFPIFASFTVVCLLLQLVLKSSLKLAAFGAFWICESAYAVIWGYITLYPILYGGVAVLAAYHLLKSDSRKTQILCGVSLGLAIAGFAMILYPPWQVPPAYLFGLLLAGLVVRDRLYLAFKIGAASRYVAIAVGLTVAGILLGAFFLSSWGALNAAVGSGYPGQRRVYGGDYPLWSVFIGFYNLYTSFKHFSIFAGPENNLLLRSVGTNWPASYYLFFPALGAPLLLSSRWRRAIGLIGWLLIGYIAFLLVFDKFGFPHLLARITLMDRVLPVRTPIALGPASIILCLLTVQWAQRNAPSLRGYGERFAPFFSGASVAVLFALTGLVLSARTHGFPPSFAIALVSLGSGYASYCMVAGNTRTFCALILVALLPLVWLYNPLSTNLDYIYKSELAQQIEKLDQGSERPLWVCYGEGKPNFWSPGSYGGLLVSTLGGRAMTGIQWPPAVDFWRALDPTRKYEKYYNDYAHVYLLYTNGDEVSFSSPGAQSLYVKIAPDNQVLKQIGAKYILAMDDAVNQIDINKYPLIYKSRDGFFSIFEIP